MARTKKDTATEGGGEARVLSDIPGLARCGDLLVAPVAQIQAFAATGQVDPHPEAVDYARSTGATVITIEG